MGDARENVSAGKPGGDPEIPDHAGGRPVVARRWARCLAPTTTRRHETIFAGLNYPGAVAHVAAISTRTGDVAAPRGHQGPAHLSGRVARLGSQGPGAVLHDRQWRASRPGVARLRRPAARACCKRMHASGTWPSTARISRSGASVTSTAWPPSSAWTPPYTEWTRAVTLPYGTVVYDLDVSADGSMVLGIVRRHQRQAGSAGAVHLAALLKGEATPIATFDFRGGVPNGFMFSEDGRFLYGSCVSDRRLEHLPVRDRDEEARRGVEHRHRVLPSHSPRRR